MAGLLLSVATLWAGTPRLEYPPTRRVDQVDVYHGVRVADPYRWLEQDLRQSAEVAQWVAAQNRLTASYLAATAAREKIRRRLTELWNYPRYSPPFKEGPFKDGGKSYYFSNDGLQSHSVLYAAAAAGAGARVLIDPNRWSADGTIALGQYGFSGDGRYLAYSRTEAGSKWCTWQVLEIASGRLLPDELKWTKGSRACWTRDSQGFFYSRYDEPPRGSEFRAANVNHRVCYHRVGTPQSADAVAYGRSEHFQWRYDAQLSEDGRYLVITVNVSNDDRDRVLVKDLAQASAAPRELVDRFEHQYSFVGNDGPLLFFQTDAGAPRGRLLAVDVGGPPPGAWREIIPQAEATLYRVTLVGRRFVARYLKDVLPQVKIFSERGQLIREVQLPGIGAVSGFDGRRDDPETYYTFSSFATPPSVYRYDVATGESRLWRRSQSPVNPEDYEVHQAFCRSKDGTRVPLFLAFRKGTRRDGARPTLLYGYGGVNVSELPSFSIADVAWMEMGGVYAQANLRGGGEYGTAWHEAGTRLNKQNVFDDFIAVAEWLIAQRYTRPGKLAIEGVSNGGLLVGAVMTQRPELFGACLPTVGVLDMLRFQRFTDGRFWVNDYGSVDDPRQFRALWAYSPYHHVRPGTRYPATLIATADTDDCVVPAHSFKFAAALQQAQAGNAPILLRVAARAGHGSGKSTRQRIEQAADQWAFLAENLGLE
jgi:prolyl oligopeptidase